MKKAIVFKITAIILAVTTLFSVHTAFFSASAASSDGAIISAEYIGENDRRDVKAVLSGMVDANGKIAEFVVDDSSMGCSPAGEENYLLVKYKENNTTKYASVKEGNTFSIPFKYDPVQPEETQALIDKPLTVSTAEKIWPETGVRGFNFGGLVGSYSANPGNEGMYVTEETFKLLKSWGVNCLRIPMAADSSYDWVTETIPEDDPIAPYRHNLEALKVALHLAEKYDMWIIPSGDNVVGRQIDIMYNGSDGTGYNETLKQLWLYIAENYGSHPNLLGYDLLNEPNTSNDIAYYMDTVLPMLVDTIRSVDKNTYIIVEPASFALPGYFAGLKPIDDPKTVYSFHFYYPHQYTHQGIGEYSEELTYPGMIANFPTDSPTLWNKAKIKESVQAVVDFQRKYNARIWIGEFGVVRWAGNPAQWIRDTISIWEEYGWDWCYHSYGGYNGFNQTFDKTDATDNVMDGGKDTDAIKALKEGFALNGKPKDVQFPSDQSKPSGNKNAGSDSEIGNNSEPGSSDSSMNEEPVMEEGIVVLKEGGISVASDILSENWSLETSRISDGQEYNAIKAVLPVGTQGFAIYNLKISDESGSNFVPSSKLEVIIPLSAGMSDVVVYYVDEGYKLVPLTAYIDEYGIAFETDKLGSFVILKQGNGNSVSYIISTTAIILICVVAVLAVGEAVYFIVSVVRRKRGRAV